MSLYSPKDFFDLTDSPAADLFAAVKYVWEAVAALPAFIESSIKPRIAGEVEEGAWIESGKVQLGEGSRIERGAVVRGPTIIGNNTVVRSKAYIRGHVMIGDGCLIGHGTELRQLLVLNNSNIPHLNCFFTSLVGNRVRIGGATSTGNFRLDGKEVMIRIPVNGKTESFPTGQTLFGCVVGDECNVAGNCLIYPGAVLGRRCLVYPLCPISGYVPEGSLMRPVAAPVEIIPEEDWRRVKLIPEQL